MDLLADGSGQASEASEDASLVLYGERSTDRPASGCPNFAQGLRLAVHDVDGPRYLKLRCQRRDCRYCGWLRDLEDATCLYLDAAEQQPALAITLTTAQPWEHLDPGAYRRASSQLWRALRARYGRVEYVGLIEFTSGRARQSGGHRRMHGHYLVKGIDPEHVLDVERLVREVWERCTGAYVVEVSELRSAGGAIAYMGLHHRKPEQAAPEGWRGMRMRASQGYWHTPIASLREQARERLAIRTATYKLVEAGTPAEIAAGLAGIEVQAQREARERHGTRLVEVREPRSPGGVVEPLGEWDRGRSRAEDHAPIPPVDASESGGPAAPGMTASLIAPAPAGVTRPPGDSDVQPVPARSLWGHVHLPSRAPASPD